MRHGSLFSGGGGFDLASEWMGWENMFHCENNPFCQQVLKYYWPDAKSYGDIKTTDFTIWRGGIDILTGGFPCQPYSTAGKRLGKEDDRHLWPEMLRAIREIQPGYVVGENVRGLTNWNGGLVFNEVQADLEIEGYEVIPFLLPACAVNAPHRRDRIWFIAHASKDGFYGAENRQGYRKGNDYNTARSNAAVESSRRGYKTTGEAVADPNGDGYQPGRFTESGFKTRESEGIENKRQWVRNDAGRIGEQEIITNTSSIGQQGSRRPVNAFGKKEIGNWKASWAYNDDRWPIESPVCSRDDGFSSQLDGITFSKWRTESLKLFGNAIVPELALQIFKAIESLTSLVNK